MPIDELALWVSDGCRELNLYDACDALYDDVFGSDVTWPQAVIGSEPVKRRTFAVSAAQSESGRQIGCPQVSATCSVGLPHRPPPPADLLHEPFACKGSGSQWEVKHPLSWSRDDVLDWLFSVASRKEYGVDFLRYPAESFCNATGVHLAAMSEGDFVHRMGPDYGRLLHDLFWQTMGQCDWPSLAAPVALPPQQHPPPPPPPPVAPVAVESGCDDCLGEMLPQRFPPQSVVERAIPTTMATVTSPGSAATAILTSEGGTAEYGNSREGRGGPYQPDPYAQAFTPGRSTCSVAVQDYGKCGVDEAKAASFDFSSSFGEPLSKRPSWPLQKQRQQQFLREHERLMKPEKSPILLLDTFKLDRSNNRQRSTDSEDSGIFSQSGSIAEPACSGDSQDGECRDEECNDDEDCCDEESDGDRTGVVANISQRTREAKRCSSRDETCASYSSAETTRDPVRCQPDGMSAATAKSKLLWEFVRDLLKDPQYNPRCIKWEDKAKGVFRFVQSDIVAKMWGRIKNNENMTYEKLSRAMRYYYKRGILERVDGKRLVYKFSAGARGWS